MHRHVIVLIVPALALTPVRPVLPQALGLPAFGRFVGRGSALAVDYGTSNGVATFGVRRAIGATATISFGSVNDSVRILECSATAARVTTAGGSTRTSAGVNLTLGWSYQVGIGYVDSAGETRLHVPIGVTLPLVKLVSRSQASYFWIHAGMDYHSESHHLHNHAVYGAGAYFDSRPGLGVQVAAERTSMPSGAIWTYGIGLHWSLRSLPRGE